MEVFYSKTGSVGFMHFVAYKTVLQYNKDINKIYIYLSNISYTIIVLFQNLFIPV